MIWPAWFSFFSPLKFSLWAANRAATWTGLFYFWRKFRSQRFFWLWMTLINLASLGALALLFFWLHTRTR